MQTTNQIEFTGKPLIRDHLEVDHKFIYCLIFSLKFIENSNGIKDIFEEFGRRQLRKIN